MGHKCSTSIMTALICEESAMNDAFKAIDMGDMYCRGWIRR